MRNVTSTSYGLSIVTAPTADALSLEETKKHLRVDIDDDDDYIQRLIVVARNHVQEHTLRRLLPTTLDFRIDRFPCGSKSIELPVMNVTEVTSVKYINGSGVLTTMDSADWKASLDREPPRITPAWSKWWPVTREEVDAVTIRLVAGYADPSCVPEDIKQAMLLLIGHLHENREEVITGTISKQIEKASEALLAPYSFDAEFTEFGSRDYYG